MRHSKIGYSIGAAGVFAVVLLLLPLRAQLNSTPVALTFLLTVLFTAARYGSAPAYVTSILALLCFNFFFIPPYHTLVVGDPQNWIAMAAFLITSVIAGNLSARERRKATEVQRLYTELQNAFEKASEAEALKRSEQLKSALLDAVTHDLRTPLTSMKAAVTTLLSTSSAIHLDDEGRRELLEVIDSEIDRLNRLFEGLIAIARIEAGAMEPRRAWSNLEEIVSIAVDRAANISSQHKITEHLEEDLPAIHVDEKALAEVLFVLIENATKYSPPNTEIRIQATKTEEDVLQISIQDSGIGIPREMREKVFDKFFRLSAGQRTSGLGMGLAIARGIVEAHGGRIWIEDSRSGKGTRVSFTIPLKEQQTAIV